MDDRAPTGNRRNASAGFTRLLARLGPDDERAAAEYERLRLTLERFFDWRGAWPPEECADETLDRLARKLGEEIEIVDLWGYARGIARLVLLEWQRRPLPVPLDERLDLADRRGALTGDYDAPLRVCFEQCLRRLTAEKRALVLDYYVAERREKIDNRRQLALKLGLSETALRNRVQRVRDRLERCVLACTTEGPAGAREDEHPDDD